MMFGIDSLYIWLAVIIISVAVEAFYTYIVRHLVRCRRCRGTHCSQPFGRTDGAVDCVHRVLRAAACTGASALPPFSRQPAAGDQLRSYHRTEAVVTEPIDNVLETGAVKINGKIWTARSMTDAQIAIGTRVTVVEIRGVRRL